MKIRLTNERRGKENTVPSAVKECILDSNSNTAPSGRDSETPSWPIMENG